MSPGRCLCYVLAAMHNSVLSNANVGYLLRLRDIFVLETEWSLLPRMMNLFETYHSFHESNLAQSHCVGLLRTQLMREEVVSDLEVRRERGVDVDWSLDFHARRADPPGSPEPYSCSAELTRYVLNSQSRASLRLDHCS